MDGGIGAWLFIIVICFCLLRALACFLILYSLYNILIKKNKEKKYFIFLFVGIFIIFLSILFIEL